MTTTMMDNYEEKSIQYLKPFLIENKEKVKARDNVEDFMKNITYI